MLYRRQPRVNTTQFCGDWWEVISTESEADGDHKFVVALCETETMALHIQLIPEMKAALTELLRVAEHQLVQSATAYGLTNCDALAKARGVLANLKVLE